VQQDIKPQHGSLFSWRSAEGNLATVICAFNLNKSGKVSAPRPPLYVEPETPLDLSERRFKLPGVASDELAKRLLNLDMISTSHAISRWQAAQGDAEGWSAALRSAQVMARRSTLSLLWGVHKGGVRVRQQAGLLYLDRAEKMKKPVHAYGHRTATVGVGRRFEVAATAISSSGDSESSAFFAATLVDLPSNKLILLNEVDCVQEADGVKEVVELKTSGVHPSSEGFAGQARRYWAQCVLGAVNSLVVGHTDLGILNGCTQITLEELSCLLRNSDKAWCPKRQLAKLMERLEFVRSCCFEGCDLVVFPRYAGEGMARLKVEDRQTGRVIKLSEPMPSFFAA